MGQVLPGCATTTEAIHRVISGVERAQGRSPVGTGSAPPPSRSGASVRPPATPAWGPKQISSSALTVEQEAIIVAFRQHTLLPLDDCLYALQATIPGLTRSNLHRCLQRHGSAALPPNPGCPIPTPPWPASGPRHTRSASCTSTSNQRFAGHRRGPHRAGQAAPVRRQRPHQQVRLRAAARQGHAPHRRQLPACRGRSRAVQDVRIADRQPRSDPPEVCQQR